MASNIQLNHPSCVVVNEWDEIFICDRDNHRVRKIMMNGKIQTIAGNGECGFGGDGRLATCAMLNCPSGVFVYSDEIYIADSGNNVIRKVSSEGIIRTIIGNGKCGWNGDGMASDINLSFPTNIVVNSAGEVIFSDQHNRMIRIMKIDRKVYSISLSAEFITQVLNTNTDVFYIADLNKNIIKKIKKSLHSIFLSEFGNIKYEDIPCPATEFLLSSNESVFVCNDVIFSIDTRRIRIQAAVPNVRFEIDNSGTHTTNWFSPNCVFLSGKGELYFSDSSTHSIRTIEWRGCFNKLAGNGLAGFAGDVPRFGIVSNLKKMSRDEIFNSKLVVFMPLLKKNSPTLCEKVLVESIVDKMNERELQIIQNLIDMLIYGKNGSKCWMESYEPIELLFVFGLFKSGEIWPKISTILSHYTDQYSSVEKLCIHLEQLDLYMTKTKELGCSNYILERLYQYYIEYCAFSLRLSDFNSGLCVHSFVLQNHVEILPHICKYYPPSLTFEPFPPHHWVEMHSLYDDSTTSDVKIQIGPSQFVHCHKSVLSSTSSFFDALFNSGSNFADFNDEVFIPDADIDMKVFLIIVKYCYGIFESPTPDIDIFSFIDMAALHEIKQLIDYCEPFLVFTLENYFDFLFKLKPYLHLKLFDKFVKKFEKFGSANGSILFSHPQKLELLPENLKLSLSDQFRIRYLPSSFSFDSR